MTDTTSSQLLTEIVSHYSDVIHQQKKYYPRLAGLAHEGHLTARHDYVFVLLATLGAPVTDSGWNSFPDRTSNASAAGFSQNFGCAAGNEKLSFERRVIIVNLGSGKLKIDAHAPVGSITREIARSLAERAILELGPIFFDLDEIIALNALLLPQAPDSFHGTSCAGGRFPEDLLEQMSQGMNINMTRKLRKKLPKYPPHLRITDWAVA
jgi:hypothetical protein